MPAIAPRSVTRPTPAAANPRPAMPSDSVSAFGTRRVRRSIAAAVTPPPASVANTIRSDGLTNVSPEQVVNRLSQPADGADREDRDQRGEQAVLEQVLPVAATCNLPERHEDPFHDIHPFDGEQSCPLCPPLPKHAAALSSERPQTRQQKCHVLTRARDYAAGVVSALAICPKIELTFLPASVMAPTATSAISATSSAYS